MIYLLGECGDVIDEAPYSLEKLIDAYDAIASAEVKIALLTSTMKLFLLRPPEVQHMLGRLLQSATEDVSSQDLHDRALLYYRLLRSASDPLVVKEVVASASASNPMDHVNANANAAAAIRNHNFAEETFDDDIRDELMKEFNSLSIVYGTTSDNFIAEEHQVKFVKMPPEHPLDGSGSGNAGVGVGGNGSVDAAVDGLTQQVQEASFLDTNGHGPAEPAPVPAAAPAAPAPAPEMDLLGFGTEPTPSPIHAPPSSSSSPPSSGLTLDPSVTLSGEEYQTQWGSISDADGHVQIIPLTSQPSSTDAVETPLNTLASIKTMASGELPTELKFFLYAKDGSDGSLILVQASISKGTAPIEMFLTIKICGAAATATTADGGREKADAFVEVLKNALSSFV